MKHRPHALIDENLPVVVLATRDESDRDAMTRYEKSVFEHQGSKSADGIVISIVHQGDHLAREASDQHHRTSSAPELLVPLLEIIPLSIARVSHRG